MVDSGWLDRQISQLDSQIEEICATRDRASDLLVDCARQLLSLRRQRSDLSGMRREAPAGVCAALDGSARP